MMDTFVNGFAWGALIFGNIIFYVWAHGICGTANPLGVVIVFCRRSPRTAWLAQSKSGEWYYIFLDKKMRSIEAAKKTK